MRRVGRSGPGKVGREAGILPQGLKPHPYFLLLGTRLQWNSPGSPGLRVGGEGSAPPTRPSLPWRHEQATEGSRLSRTSCGKTPSMYRHNAWPCPGSSGLDGAPCGRAAWQRARPWRAAAGKRTIRALTALCAWAVWFLGTSCQRSPSALLLPLARGPGCPVPCPAETPKMKEYVCLSVLQIICQIACPKPLLQAGFSGIACSHPKPFVYVKAASAVWGPRGGGGPGLPWVKQAHLGVGMAHLRSGVGWVSGPGTWAEMSPSCHEGSEPLWLASGENTALGQLGRGRRGLRS